ncbi:hypothetical protein PCANC_17709 [Puccinia coronata f. sp. avenae]|uniref:RRM domain-containing protein n=1 Tax=Puccinia coronata f. sp. avenae TaxID=200324 RepID=A0A2N5SHM4_9BASI|nr:hypothetical protein PCANC_17709 [Puccinia coronata f. sp. avenae]
MLDQLFLHLVQYADELKNHSKPSIECTLFKNLEKIKISHTNEPSLTAEYRTSSHIDFSPPSSKEGNYSSPKFQNEELDPVDCLRYSAEFHFPPSCPESVSSATDSYTGSSNHKGSEETDPFCSSDPAHSRVSSDRCAVDGASQVTSFNPFADPLFYLPFRPRQSSRQNPTRLSRIAEQPHPSRPGWSDEQAPEHSISGASFMPTESTSIIPDMDPDAVIPPTNVFVANFPSHWSKSDLWDLFDGIPVSSVHVLPEKRTPNEETVYGGTGFVNITRASDAHALLAMLDKKIWLIDGSALKFRLANSSPPTDPVSFHVPKKNRTVRRHQHKVIDRLRAEQTVGNKQLACCDRHQMVVYQNIPSLKTRKPTLSVVHGSRQRNSHFACNAAEADLATTVCQTQRPFLEFLKSHLNRRNYYNSQQIVTASLRSNPPIALAPALAPIPLRDITSKPLNQGNPVMQRLDMKPQAFPPPGPYFRGVEIPILPPRIPYAPSPTYHAWPSNAPPNAPTYNQVNAPCFSLQWVPTPPPTHPHPQFSSLNQGSNNYSMFLPRIP